MLYRIYDRYENDTIAIADIGITENEVKKLKKEFGKYLQPLLEKNEADDDLTEFYNFLKAKKIKVKSFEYEEIDL
jgi:hypothetical protein